RERGEHCPTLEAWAGPVLLEDRIEVVEVPARAVDLDVVGREPHVAHRLPRGVLRNRLEGETRHAALSRRRRGAPAPAPGHKRGNCAPRRCRISWLASGRAASERASSRGREAYDSGLAERALE